MRDGSRQIMKDIREDDHSNIQSLIEESKRKIKENWNLIRCNKFV